MKPKTRAPSPLPLHRTVVAECLVDRGLPPRSGLSRGFGHTAPLELRGRDSVQFVKDWNRSDEAAPRALLEPPAAVGRYGEISRPHRGGSSVMGSRCGDQCQLRGSELIDSTDTSQTRHPRSV